MVSTHCDQLVDAFRSTVSRTVLRPRVARVGKGAMTG